MLVLRNNNVRDEADMLSVTFNGESLANVKSYKYLGINLDGNLSYDLAVHNISHSGWRP